MCAATPALIARQRRAHRGAPCDYRENLPGQQRFLDAMSRAVVWFGANGTGKTEALSRRLIRVFRGLDPICKLGKSKLSLLLVVTGYDAVSARDMAQQIYELAPPDLLGQVPLDDEGRPMSRSLPWYAPGKGFRGRPPRIVVQTGPMKGTVLNVATLGAGVMAAAGGTVDLVIVNEPVSRALIDELSTRDRADALGYLWYAFTPLPDAPDQTWIPDWVESKGDQAQYIQVELTPQALTFPSGRTLESWDEKTAPRIAGWDHVSRPMRMGRSLEPIISGAIFADIWRDSLVVPDLPAGPVYYLVHSVDHGLKAGRMRAGVTAYHVTGPSYARKLIGYDVVDVQGDSNYDRTAETFLAELERRFPRCIPSPGEQSLHQLHHIDEAVGDRSIQADHGAIKRDNWAWTNALLDALRRRERDPRARIPRAVWEIATPYKPPGSSIYRILQLHAAMSADPPEFMLLRHIEQGIKDVQRFDGRKDSPHKDYFDRVAYGRERAMRHFGLWRREA